MNFDKFDVYRLTILWQLSSDNIELKKLIESELKKRVSSNSNFSREYLYYISKVKNQAVTISFIPTTDSYKNYGQKITIDLVLTESEREELVKNKSADPPVNTSGQLRARNLVKNNMTESQQANLEEEGFHTREILEVLHIWGVLN